MPSKYSLEAQRALDDLIKKDVDTRNIKPSKKWEWNLGFLDTLYPLQRQILEDPAKRKCIQAGRRAGKSYLLAVMLLDAAIKTPGETAIYFATTRDSARDMCWRELKDLNDAFSLDIKFKEMPSLTATLKNGSEIRLDGCPTRDRIEKFRGRRYSFICVDEAGSFGDYLEELVEHVLEYKTWDLAAPIVLSGNPNASATGFFYECCEGNRKDKYKTWHFNILDNERFPLWRSKPDWQAQAKAFLDGERIKAGRTENNPIYRREDLGLWVRDGESLVVPFSAQNVYDQLPEPMEYPSWHWIIGVDFGVVDATSIVVGGWTANSPNLYIVDNWQMSFDADKIGNLTKAIYETTCDKIREYAERYNPDAIVGDPGGGGKIFIQDIANKYSLPIFAADKRSRPEQMELFIDSFRTGRIKVNPYLKEMIDEFKTLQWGNRKRCEFARGFQDHAFDACRYLWHESYNHMYKAQPRKQDAYTDEQRARIDTRIKQLKEQERDEWDLW